MTTTSLPKTTSQYVLEEQKGFDSLKLQHDIAIPELGDHDVLVQIQAVSLNYRDLIIAKGTYPFPVKLPIIPGSDAAGNVLAIGPKVVDFEVGDKVCTLFNQLHQAGPITLKAIASGLGGAVDGTLRQYAVFPQTGLVAAPSNLTPTEAGTLSCAPLTAWNALYGLESKALKQGQSILTQGTGGVSLSAVQFGVATGAVVIATSSSDEKCAMLKKMGATHVINYKNVKNWGEEAKKLSPGGEGVDHVVEIGGPNTMAQSLKAVRPEGVISVIGFVGGAEGENNPSTLDSLTNICTIRGILVGSRAQFKEMNRAIDATNIHPVVAEKVFDFENLKDAYQYQWDQKHTGNVVVHLGRLQ